MSAQRPSLSLSTKTPAPGASARLGRLSQRVADDGLTVAVFLIVLVVLLLSLPYQIQQDSWLTLVAGREVAHGLPSHDTLTAWSVGRSWVDQQWLAQLVFYQAAAASLKLAALLHVLTTAGSFALALFAARRLGGSTRTTPLIAILAFASIVATWQLRAQSLALPLFVALALLLVADARRPSRHVLLVLPLLALWANLHGSVVMAAGLVMLRGLLLLRERRGPWRALSLLLAPPLLVFASPYGFSLFGYYHHMLFNPLLSRFVSEWRPSSPSIVVIPFYGLAILALALLAKRRARSLFEVLSLLVLLLSAGFAVRNLIWFGLFALVLLPGYLGLKGRAQPLRAALVPAALAAATLAVLCLVLLKPTSWYYGHYSVRAAQAVAHAAHGNAVIFSDVHDADWLLWQQPSLKGRLAYDARLELLSKGQFNDIVSWYRRRGAWLKAPSREGGKVLVFIGDPTLSKQRRRYQHQGQVLYQDRHSLLASG